MGWIPNMPHVSVLALAAALGGGGWVMYRRQQLEISRQAQEPAKRQAAADAAAAEASWDDVALVDPLGLEVGYRLIPLVDHAQNGELLHRLQIGRASCRERVWQNV